MRTVRIGLAQINTMVGDLEGNAEKVREVLEQARAAGCGLVAFPELAVTGYPPEDLVLRRAFCEASREVTASLAEATRGLVAVVGFVDWREDDAFNAAAVFADGRWVDTYAKQRLPNYGVFDEERYFRAGRRSVVYQAGDVRFGVSICEDIWYPGAPLDALALAGAELCVNINASPYARGKARERERMLATRAVDNRIAVAYVNAVGGQDELVFDGASVVFDAEGRLAARARQFDEELLVVGVDFDEVAQRRLHDPRRRVELRARDWVSGAELVDLGVEVATAGELVRPGGPVAPLLGDEEEVWRALVLATRDYLHKTGFREAIIGLSGGIDSAVVAAVAVDALGAERVMGVSMPSRYSSEHSREDARELAENLGIRFLTIPIEPAHAAMLTMLGEV
ncbi:nitrilase-related carbon-nitrogen hydrolase, partial [Tepidiforma sp.]|uniref:nitrilase-related carbon-nitrogen hydrolase n=1 Tax=Tepidiforma sp. TaxID=2682230 RepID=UPI002ADE5227